jgi:WD40 repeat protein
MPDVFISYSRRNGEFVHKLHDALVERGKDVWVDWEDIPPAAEWPKEIDEGIEGSDNFLFVISPDSVVSRVCMKELGHAVSQQKRLVPLLYEDVDEEAVPEALASRNWIFARNGTELAPADLERLLEALETDLEWVSTHTRLLGRALEWERNGRDSSFVLRGRDLDEAERSVASRPTDREPQPTQLQSEYLLASRRAATRRQRVVITAALAAVAVSAGLAVLAWTQRNAAVQEAKVARSRELAAEAVAQLRVDPERSLVLAARAATTEGTAEATDALRQALSGSRLRKLVDVGTAVNDVAFGPDGRVVAAALRDGSVRIWNARTWKPVGAFRLRPGEARSVSFSANGRRVLAAGDAGAAVWSTAPGTREPLSMFDDGRQPTAAALSPDGKLAATADFGVVRLWRAATGARVGRLVPPGKPSLVTSVAFSGDGSKLVAASGSLTAVWTLGAASAPAVQRHEKEVWAAAFSRDGAHVATGDEDGVARVWTLRKRGVVVMSGHEGAVRHVAFSPDGGLLVTASDDETARIWDAESGRSLGELRGHDGIVPTAAFAPDGMTVVTGGYDGTIRLWSVASDPVRAALIRRDERTLRGVDFDASGARIVTASEDRTGQIWNVARGRVVKVLPHGHGRDDWVESAEFSRDGRFVLTAGDDGTAKLWDASTGSLVATLPPGGGPALRDAALSPDGRLVATAGAEPIVRVWRWRERRMIRTLRTGADRVDGVAFSPDGSLVAAAAADGAVHVWRVGDGAAAAVLRGRDELTSVSFDPSGTLVAAGSTSGSTWIWNIRTREPLAVVTGHSDTVSDVGFGAGGRYLVTVGLDGVANVWTVPDGRPVTSLRTEAGSLEGAAFAPTRRDLAVVGTGGRLTVFECAECRPLTSLVCLASSRVSPGVRAREQDVFSRCD